MRSTKAVCSCSFPAVKRLQGNRKHQPLKQKYHIRTFSFEVPRITNTPAMKIVQGWRKKILWIVYFLNNNENNNYY